MVDISRLAPDDLTAWWAASIAFRTAHIIRLYLSSHGGKFSSFNIFCFTNCIKSGCYFFAYTCATRSNRYDTDLHMESPGVTAVIQYNVFLDVIK